jgi:hypothetical protein
MRSRRPCPSFELKCSAELPFPIILAQQRSCRSQQFWIRVLRVRFGVLFWMRCILGRLSAMPGTLLDMNIYVSVPTPSVLSQDFGT